MSYRLLDKFILVGLMAMGFLACKDFSFSDDESDGDDAAGFTITYNANGATSGSVPVDSTKYTQGKTVTVKANTGNLAKTGYAHDGWNTLADGNGTTYSYGQSFAMGGANVTLYAKWKESLTALWARSLSSGDATTRFHGVATDSSGNVYAVGIQEGTTTYTYGPEVTATAGNSAYNAVLVKYDPAGTALWARVATTAPDYGGFYGVAADSSGNVYAVGFQNGTSSFTYGPSASVAGGGSMGSIVIVKYDSSGTALWARSVSAVAGSCSFSAVTTDSSGNVYAVGRQDGSEMFDYGNGKNATGNSSPTGNALIVKYDTNGTTQWAKTSTTSNTSRNSYFNGVAADASGYVYAVGIQEDTGTFNYGGEDVTGGASINNAIIVKYVAATGAVSWNQSSGAGSVDSSFSGVAVDSSGNVYAAGSQVNGTNSYGGTGVTGEGPLLVKYTSGGTGLWARSVAGGGEAGFSGVAVDSSGNVYCTWDLGGAAEYDFGGATAKGAYSGGTNATIVKYDSSGNALRARSVSEGSDRSSFTGVSIVPGGDVFAVGIHDGSLSFTYGTGVSATGYNDYEHSVIVKYLR